MAMQPLSVPLGSTASAELRPAALADGVELERRADSHVMRVQTMNPPPRAGALVAPMLTALLIFIIGRIRRRLKKAKDTTSLIVDAFADMQEMRRIAQQRYPFLDL